MHVGGIPQGGLDLHILAFRQFRLPAGGLFRLQGFKASFINRTHPVIYGRPAYPLTG